MAMIARTVRDRLDRDSLVPLCGPRRSKVAFRATEPPAAALLKRLTAL